MSFVSILRARGLAWLRPALVALVACAVPGRPPPVAAADAVADGTDDRSPWLTLTTDANPFFTAIGSATSQGVTVLRADQARAIFGVTGAGVTLGVISDSFNGSGSTPTLATQIAAGNLPGAGNPDGYTTGVTVVNDDSGTDEGRAMLEIVHDVAPGARLYFHSAFNNTNPTTNWTGVGTPAPDQSIADAIDGLAAVSGMRVIVDDVGYLTAARFQDGAAARSADAAFARGIAYFSAAGNSATDATRVTTSVGVSGTVNWGTDGLLLMRVNANSTGYGTLQWGEPYPSVSGSAATSDFQVAVTTTNGATTYFAVNGQAAGQDPYEFIGVSNAGSTAVNFALRVTRLSGTAPVVMQLSTYGPIAIIDADKTNAPTVYGQAAAAGAVGVAATYWNTGTSVEYFSSRGPTLILFDANGNPVTETRSTPLLTAPDGGTTTTSGFNPFYGTSAAAPHAAAVAALVLERFDQKGITVSTRDLYRVLEDSAIDIGTAGFDTASGHGRIDALAAVSAGRIWDGNGATAGVAASGTWSQAAWTLEAAGDKPTGRFIRGQRAIFGSGTAAQASYAIVVDGTYDVTGLSFVRDTVTLASGSGALRLTDPMVDVASGLVATVSTALTGSAGLVKTGAGTLRLGGSTGYTGGTTVSAGSIVVDGTVAGAVTVAAGATLGGSGTIVGDVAVSGTHAPGNSPGIATILGDLTYGIGASVAWELAANADAQGPVGARVFDQIVVDGDLAFSGSTALTLSFRDPGPGSSWTSTVDWNDAFWTSGHAWTLWDVSGTTTGLANLSLRTDPWLDSQGTAFATALPGRSFSVALAGSDVMLLYAVPEPGTLALLVTGLCGLAACGRRLTRGSATRPRRRGSGPGRGMSAPSPRSTAGPPR